MIKKTLLIVLTSASIHSPYSMAIEGGREVLDAFNINVHGNIEAESCISVSEGGADISYDIGNISIKELTKNPSLDFKPDSSVGNIKFTCDVGTFANFKIGYTSPQCMSNTNIMYACGGTNKSVGLITELVWKDKTGAVREVFLNHTDQHNNEVRTVQLDSNKTGEIQTMRTIRVRGVRDAVIEPGAIGAELLLQIWAP